MNAPPLCGFVRADLSMCDTPSPCEAHTSARWNVCVGCGSKAVRACSTPVSQGACNMALCVSCLHHEDGSHGAMQAEDVTGVRDQFAEIRADLEAVIGRILAEQAQQNRLRFPDTGAVEQVSREVLQGLGLHLVVLHMSALARHAQATS